MANLSWDDLYYNSAQRSTKLRKERRANAVKMKGTFEQQSAAELAKINLRMATEIQRQKLANAGQLAATKEGASNRLAGTKYSSDTQERISKYGWDTRKPYYDAEASKLGAEEDTTRIKNLYVPNVMQQLVDANNGRTPLTDTAIEDALAPKRRRKRVIDANGMVTPGTGAYYGFN